MAMSASEQGAGDNKPPLIFRYLKASADAVHGFGIDEVMAVLNEAARGQEPRPLFPRFEAEVPKIWQRARGLLEAMKRGSDTAAAFLNPEELKGQGDAASNDIIRHHVSYAELVALRQDRKANEVHETPLGEAQERRRRRRVKGGR